jgi:hypothetical protein
MRLTAPLFVGSRLMAAVKVGEEGDVLHVEPLRRDSEGRVVWRYIVEDGDRRVLDEGADLRSGAGDPVDPRKAMATLVGFLGAAADQYRVASRSEGGEDARVFPPNVAEWAYMHEDELASLALELGEPEIGAPVRPPNEPYLRFIGSGEAVPPGWITEPVGEWDGHETEVVFDPRRHHVMVVQASATEDREGDLSAEGWAYQGTDGYRVMWVRDRLAAARTALDRHSRSAAPEVASPGPELGGPEL